VISFLVVGSFWIGHHRRFRLIKRYDSRLLFLNLLLMMAIAFIPFPTSIISENGNRAATIFYALTVALTGLLSALLWWYASHQNRLTDKLDTAQHRHSMFYVLITPTVFLASIGVAFIDPDLAKFSWMLIAPTVFLFR
jgi:uncharacterized membrane protein